MHKLTKRQTEVLAIIEQHLQKHGSPPTRSEIARSMGFQSPNAAEDHLRALAKKNRIQLLPGTSRGIRLLDSPQVPPLHLPFLENAQSLLAFALQDELAEYPQHSVDPGLFPKEYPPALALRMPDDTLKSEGIRAQDWLLVHLTKTVLSKSDSAIYFLIRQKTVRIERLSEAMSTATALNPSVQILGLMVGLIRSI